MALYSNNLSGLVLLTDDAQMCLDQGSVVAHEFSKLCNLATEFHFPSFEQQLESSKDEHLGPAISWRLDYIANNQSLLPLDDQQQEHLNPPIDRLKCGDFYITRHSNLCDTHVVFHLVTDTTSVYDGNIDSRHPVVMGLRNVLKVASMSSVTTITVPLLLSHTMEESLPISWLRLFLLAPK